MTLFNQDILNKVLSDYKAKIPIEAIIAYLEEETRKPVKESKINLNTLDPDRPNVIPWNVLGLKLREDNEFHASEKVWRKMIALAYEQAPERYLNVPPIGLPFNNLALILQDQGKHNDALVALMRAYTFDIQTGNPGPVARNNFVNIFSQVLNNFSPAFEIFKSKKDEETKNNTEKNNRKSSRYAYQPPIFWYGLMVWLSFFMPTLFGGYMLYLYPDNWYFLFLILIGIISPYFYKDVSIKVLGGDISVKNPLKEMKSGSELQIGDT
ncbi:MAG: hypothetical protein CV087_22855 [Candidatus Brocadia sp. WS118]|nr:MAG: hypothetical protein CV087_22855 [Candidatus Brocadia sp. WS118]